MTLGPGTAKVIKSLLNEKGLHASIRIDTGFTGCCDASLTLAADSMREGDLVEDIDGITFLVNSDVYKLSGNIHISYVEEPGKKGFSVTSEHPISEWQGFGVCEIKI